MELTNLGVTIIRNQIFPSNTYILKSKYSNQCLVIDPGLDKPLIEQTVANLGLIPVAVLATHGHFDHIGNVSYIKNEYNAPYYLHSADLKLSKSANFFLKMAHIKMPISIPVPDVLFTGFHEHVTISDFELDIYNYPGHSDGSCVIQHQNLLFSGDIIYKYGLGFNNFPGENKTKLKASIIDIFKNFQPDSWILPGHGEPELLRIIKENNHHLMNFLNVEQ